MAGTTYSKFFWQDFQADDELRLCSLGAQGLWMRLLCMAARANPIGHVLVGGKDPTPADIRRITGCSETDEQILAYRAELIDKQVCDVTGSGVLVSRRLVRDAKRRGISSKGGKARQAQRLEVPAQTQTGTSHIAQPSPPATINHQPESINHQPQKPLPETFEQKLGKIAQLGQALGFDPTTARNGHRFIEDLVRLQADGFDFELDILATIQERRAAGSIPRDLGSLAYFRKAFEAKRETRKLTAGIAEARAATPVEDTDAAGWDQRLARWLESGWWPPQYGPRPLTGNCLAAPERVAVAKERWEEQGGHPRGAFPADPNGRFQDWKDLRNLRDDPNVDYGNRALNVVAIPRRTA